MVNKPLSSIIFLIHFLPTAHAFYHPLHKKVEQSSSKSPRFNAKPKTTVDETVDSPASILFYDDVLNSDLPEGVVCARGVCVLADDEDADEVKEVSGMSPIARARLILFGSSILYGTNFPLGAMMNDSLPASAATSSRMILAAVALSPFLPRLKPELAPLAFLCGLFTATGYVSQSLALVDTSPSTVSFLGAATVVVCPLLEAIINKRKLGLKEAPQVWLSAALCITGVGILELAGTEVSGSSYTGDALALLQAVGFGTSFFLTEKLMRGNAGMALPITAVQVSVTAAVCAAWCVLDPSGWLFEDNNFTLDKLILNPNAALYAIVWTGLITTAFNRILETLSLGKLASAEASVILATEPLFAALIGALFFSERFGDRKSVV